MKTRIKVVQYANGVTEYIPQYKNIMTWPGWGDVDPFGIVNNHCLDSVKKFIDEFLERNSKENRKKRRIPPVVSYIDYP